MRNQLLLVAQLEYLLRRYNIRILIIRILLISAQLYTRTIPPLETSPPPKTPTCSDIRSRKGIRSITAPPTLLLIPSTPSTTSSTITPTSIEDVRVYLVITISAYINIVYKQVAKVVKDIQAIDYQLSKLKGPLSKIKDKLTFIKRSITILIYNARLLDIELKQIQVSYCYRQAIIIGLE